MSEIAKRLRDRRLNVVNEMRTLVDVAVEEGRDLSGEETGKYQLLNEEIDRLDERIHGVLDQEKRAKDADDAFNAISRKPVTGPAQSRNNGGDKGDDGSTFSDELRAFAQGKSGHAFEVPGKTVDFRALSKLTAGAGANTVPTSFYDRLIAHLIETASILQAGATVLQTTGGESIQVPKTTAHSAAAIVTEGAAIAASDPAFGQITLGAYKYGLLIQVSRELISDTGVDLEGYLSMQAGRAIGNAFGAHAITGTGTSQPRGVVTDATLGVTGSTGVVGVPSADNLIDLFFSVIPPYRNSPNAAWLMKDSTVASVRKLKDTTNQYIWQPGLQAGVPDTIMGKPVITDPNVAATALSAKSILFGDFSQYFVRMVSGLRFERSDEYAFNTDLVTFRALLRADGSLVDLTGAVKYFAGAGT
jgi:HK97 family phage major capsid protein